MSKEKQIEEIADVLYESDNKRNVVICGIEQVAEDVYNAGYRKQKEGEWISKHHMSRSARGRYTSYNTYVCGACGKANGRRKTPFCPHCGAHMRKEDENV